MPKVYITVYGGFCFSWHVRYLPLKDFFHRICCLKFFFFLIFIKTKVTTNYRHLSNGLSYEIRSIEKQHPKWLQHVNLETGICSWYSVIFPFKEGLRMSLAYHLFPVDYQCKFHFFFFSNHIYRIIFLQIVPLKGEKKNPNTLNWKIYRYLISES